MVHFNWTQLIPGVTHDNIHVATAAVASGAMILTAIVARLALGSGDKAITPSGRMSLKAAFEVITEFIVGLNDMVIGEHGRKFVPMFAAIFFYILASNLIGILPGITPATYNINTTLALGIFSFLIYRFHH